MRIPDELFEAVNDFSTNLYLNIREKVHGKVNVYYNKVSDCLEVYIYNRALNFEPFHFTYPTFFASIQQGVSSFELSKKILSEYRKYINLYIWKEVI